MATRERERERERVRCKYVSKSMEQREEQKEQCRASNNQCSNIKRERRGIVEGGTAIGLDENGKLMKMHKQGWLLHTL